jgi:SAM-dependent methyltransferase
MDWDLGRYEHVAAQLFPVAEIVVHRLDPRVGERVVDIGCGTGNAALLVDRRGALTTGVDPSPRLLKTARIEAVAQGLKTDFVIGVAETLPFNDASIDAIVSVFGLIFTPDAQAAAVEMARVLTLDGRIVLSAWIPGGAIGEQARIRREAVAAALGEVPQSASFAWNDLDALTALLAPYGFSVDGDVEILQFTAASPLAYAESEFEYHPLWVEARTVLEPLGKWQALYDRALQIFVDANEDPSAFRISSRYIVARAIRSSSTTLRT